MTEAVGSRVNAPRWVDLSSSDAAGSRDFYAGLFGWKIDVNPDPQYGGYGIAEIRDGESVAGIGPSQQPGASSAWMFYLGTDEIEALTEKVGAAGGTVVMAPFDVGTQGRMAVFQDPTGAYISAWQSQPGGQANFHTDEPGGFTWAELYARDVERAFPFYESAFGWSVTQQSMGEGQPPYPQFEIDGRPVAGAVEMSAEAPAEAASYWLVYFQADDADATFRRALALGAREVVSPTSIPGGRFAVMQDPQGALFGLYQPQG